LGFEGFVFDFPSPDAIRCFFTEFFSKLEDFIVSGKEAWMITIFLLCSDSALDPKIVRDDAFGYSLYSVGDVINNFCGVKCKGS
jgi:hypothetical protein